MYVSFISCYLRYWFIHAWQECHLGDPLIWNSLFVGVLNQTAMFRYALVSFYLRLPQYFYCYSHPQFRYWISGIYYILTPRIFNLYYKVVWKFHFYRWVCLGFLPFLNIYMWECLAEFKNVKFGCGFENKFTLDCSKFCLWTQLPWFITEKEVNLEFD